MRETRSVEPNVPRFHICVDSTNPRADAICLSRMEAHSKPEFGIRLWSLDRKITCPWGMT